MSQTPPAIPQGLLLFGTDNKVYTIKDPSLLTEVQGDVHGFAVCDGPIQGVPDPEDVVAHDMKPGPHGHMHYHRHPLWGHVHVHGRGVVWALHYHPYESHFAVVLHHRF